MCMMPRALDLHDPHSQRVWGSNQTSSLEKSGFPDAPTRRVAVVPSPLFSPMTAVVVSADFPSSCPPPSGTPSLCAHPHPLSISHPLLSQARIRWLTKTEVRDILENPDAYHLAVSTAVARRPASGTLFLFDKHKVRYRKDGYEWKKKRDGRTPREDHEEIKFQGTPTIAARYAHSEERGTFHRRSYWLLQGNTSIVLVHYLDEGGIQGDPVLPQLWKKEEDVPRHSIRSASRITPFPYARERVSAFRPIIRSLESLPDFHGKEEVPIGAKRARSATYPSSAMETERSQLMFRLREVEREQRLLRSRLRQLDRLTGRESAPPALSSM
eukprot:TRINITY_DN35646_c0_g1_i1.p1 TRINITY_DN35646_c0_g1~~TRINITY_DN35646_c0_g1_i1.p1  ORF type:complete len:327 (+),score=56.83 TRINITY_DN35646_c0_g1_i1:237-1217(+)